MHSEPGSPITHRPVDVSLFEATPGISVVVLPDAPVYTHVAVSNDFVRMLGMKREEVVGKGHFEVFPQSPFDPQFTGGQNLKASFDHIVTHKQPHELLSQRYDIPNADGSFTERYWNVCNAPVIGRDGEVSYIVHSAVDVTEQVKATRKLAAVRDIEKAYGLFMQAPIIICIVQGDQYVVELANDRMLEVWGRTKEVIGRPLLQVVPELEGQGFIALLDQVRKTGQPYHANESPVTLLRHGKEEVLYFNFVYQPYYDGPNQSIATGVFGVAHDVTEQVLSRRKLEEVKERLDFRNALFESMTEATTDGIVIVDRQGEILLHNQRFVEIWNMPRSIIESQDDKAALDHAMTQLVHPEDFIKRVNHLYEEGTKICGDQLLFKDGRVIERDGTQIIGENGYYYGWAWYFRDITDRIRQEQKFRNVVQLAPDPILILKGEDLVLEVANQALFELWQVGPEALGKPFLEILPEMKEQVYLQLLRNVLHTGEPFYGNETPALFKRKSGRIETRFMNFHYLPYREVNGSITGVLVTATDVTGQVVAKQQMQESERNFRNMILQSPVAMCILKGSSFVVETANDRMFDLWGKKPDEMYNKPLFEGLPEVRDQGLEELLQHVYTTGETFSASERPVVLLRKTGLETVYVNFVYEPFREGDGTISGVMAVAIDVSEQVMAGKKIAESEEHFRTLANSISQLSWMADANGWIYWYNERWYEYTGTTLEEMEGWGWSKVHHPDHIERVVSFVQGAWKRNEPWELTFPLRSKDGQYRWFLTRGFPVKDAEGNVTRWIGTNTDINEQKQNEVLLEEKVRERTVALENKTKDLEQFTYVSHHDLKEPIRKILVFSDLIKSDTTNQLSDESSKCLDRVINSANRMSDALTDVLNYASLSKEQTFSRVNLNAVLSTVLTDLELLIAEKGAQVVVEPLPTLKAAHQQMHQLFYNLVNNALKFAKADEPPRITLTCRKPGMKEVKEHRDVDPDKMYYEITVQDNGIGFDQRKAEQIFLMFQRLHNKKTYAGTGIGLALAKKVVLTHGGKIWAESKAGNGATFKVWLRAN